MRPLSAEKLHAMMNRSGKAAPSTGLPYWVQQSIAAHAVLTMTVLLIDHPNRLL